MAVIIIINLSFQVLYFVMPSFLHPDSWNNNPWFVGQATYVFIYIGGCFMFLLLLTTSSSTNDFIWDHTSIFMAPFIFKDPGFLQVLDGNLETCPIVVLKGSSLILTSPAKQWQFSSTHRLLNIYLLRY